MRNKALLLVSALSVIVVFRACIYVFPERRHSTIGLYVKYGFERVLADRERVSFYDLHTLRSGAGIAREPGSGMVEYPPFAISLLALPVRLLALGQQETSPSQVETSRYVAAARIGLALADAMALVFMLRVLISVLKVSPLRTSTAVLSYGLAGMFLYAVLYDRMDVVMAALMVAGLTALLAPIPYYFSFALLALAIHFKLVAILMAPVWIAASLPMGVVMSHWRHQLRWLARRAAVLAVMVLGIFIPYVVSEGPRSLEFLSYHMARGIQLESLPANVALLARYLGLPVAIEHSYGSTNLVVSGANWIALCFSAAVLVFEGLACRRMWRMARAAATGCSRDASVASVMPGAVIRFTALALAIGVCGSKVFSPQYVVWFLPLIPITHLCDTERDETLQWAFVLACLFTMLVYPVFFDSDLRPSSTGLQYLPPTPLGMFLLTVRNALFVWMTWLLWSDRERELAPAPLRPDRQDQEFCGTISG